MLRYKFLLYLFSLLLATAILSSCNSSPQPPPTVTPTPSTTGSLQACVTTTATNFYQAIKDQNLTQAYSYISPTATTSGGQKLTYDIFVQQVKSEGTEGKTFTFSVGGFIANPPEVTMTIDNGQFRYHSHLRFEHTGSTCSIDSFDRV